MAELSGVPLPRRAGAWSRLVCRSLPHTLSHFAEASSLPTPCPSGCHRTASRVRRPHCSAGDCTRGFFLLVCCVTIIHPNTRMRIGRPMNAFENEAYRGRYRCFGLPVFAHRDVRVAIAEYSVFSSGRHLSLWPIRLQPMNPEEDGVAKVTPSASLVVLNIWVASEAFSNPISIWFLSIFTKCCERLPWG